MADALIEEYYREDKPSDAFKVGKDMFSTTLSSVNGYHPRRTRMTIVTDPITDTLVCDYDPTEFTETHNMDWESTPVTGRTTTPIAFKTVNPREWSMKLFFNTLGDNSKTRSDSQEKSVRGALNILRKMANPGFYNGTATSSSDEAQRPPTLIVFLIDQSFRCVITKMTVNYKAIHPLERYPTRAEVDITFSEFVESST